MTFPELLKLFSSNYPFGVIGKVFIDNEENLYVVNSSYNRIQKYNDEGEFLFGWNVVCRFSGITVRYENNTFHVFCGRYGFYYQYTDSGKLIYFTKLKYKQLNNIRNRFIYNQDKRIEIKNNFFNSYVIFHQDEEINIKIKSPWYWWLIKFPFPGLIFFIVGVIMQFFMSDKFRKYLWPKIKKRNFYKI